MDISTFIKKFNLHDSGLENFGFNLYKNQLVLTVNLCNWAQDDFKQGICPDHIVGNFVFGDVKELDLDPNNVLNTELEILSVDLEDQAGEYSKIAFTIEVGRNEDIFLLSFKTKSVEWVPIESYFDSHD